MAEAPGVHEWTLRNKRTGEVRTFEQAELTIDGEVALFHLLQRAIVSLSEKGYPFDRLVAAINRPTTEFDWREIADLLGKALYELPSLASEAACVLFGIFPFDENGGRNKDFETEKAYIRKSLDVATLVEIVKVAMEQNDYERLARPFSEALQRMEELGRPVIEQRLREARSREASTSSSPTGTELVGTSAAT